MFSSYCFLFYQSTQVEEMDLLGSLIMQSSKVLSIDCCLITEHSVLIKHFGSELTIR